jgi:hypothetical protein
MFSSTKKLTLALVLAFTAAGCEDGPAVPDADAEAANDEFSAFDVDATFDAEMLDRGGPSAWDVLAAEIPGFAGYFIDRACNINVLLVDLSQAGKAKELLTPLLRRLLASRRRCPDTATILVHQADYSWLQMKEFLHKLRPLGQVRGVLRFGISVPQNRIVVVLRARTVHASAVEAIQALDVPLAAIVFRVHSLTSDRQRG